MMGQKYLLLNPFGSKSNGVNSYIKNVQNVMSDLFDVEVFGNHRDVNNAVFQQQVLDYVTSNYAVDDVIIESPETRAASLLLNRNYNVHVRLHTPLAICSEVEGASIDQVRFSQELRVISQAKVVSSPSWGLASALERYIDTSRFFVYKNPMTRPIGRIERSARDIDVLFMGRFDRLKGAHYLNAVLSEMPAHYNCVLIGSGASRFQLHNSVKASVQIIDHLNGDERFEYIARSKVALVPSLFENCSMMILEAIQAATPVVAWAVGGNHEFAPELVRCVEFDSIPSYVSAVRDAVENSCPDETLFDREVELINDDFKNGLQAVVSNLRTSSGIYRSDRGPAAVCRPRLARERYRDAESLFSGLRIFGFSISNEHLEEMWTPVLNYIGADYRFVCKRPLGFHSKFRQRFPIKPENFSQYDWIANTDRLIKNIETFKPHILLTHNGTHPSYQAALAEIKKRCPIPMLFTELGWFPQDDHIYFDRRGVNGGSAIAASSLEALDGQTVQEHSSDIAVAKDVFIPAQLNNDTNLLVFSPRFRTVDAFVEYALREIPNDGRKIYLKPHPLDKQKERFSLIDDPRVSIVPDDTSIDEILGQVGHVVGVNSTVLLQALPYPVNIYTAGMTLLDNKGVAIDVKSGSLSGRWQETLLSSMERRMRLYRALVERQVNVAKLAEVPLVECNELPLSLHPIAEAVLMSTFIKAVPPKTAAAPAKVVAAPVEGTLLAHPVSSPNKVAASRSSQAPRNAPTGSLNRKVRKLVRNPKAFFRDMAIKRLA